MRVVGDLSQFFWGFLYEWVLKRMPFRFQPDFCATRRGRLEMAFGVFSSRVRFQVFFVFRCFRTAAKSDSRFNLPGNEFRCVGNLSPIVSLQACSKVFRLTDISM